MKTAMFFAVCFLCHTLLAQTIIIDQIEVKAQSSESSFLEGEGFSYEEVDSSELTKIAPDSLDDVLKTNTLVTTTGGPRSSAEAPQIRGLGAGKLFLYIDGARQSFRTDHTSTLAFDPSELKEVKMYKSAGSSLKGNSLGGGLILKTKDPEDYIRASEKFGGELRTSYQSVSQEKKLAGKIFSNEEGLGTLFSYSHTEAEDLILSNDKTLPHSSYLDNSFLSKFTYRKNQNERLALKVDFYKREDKSPINPTLNPPERLDELNGENELTRLTLGGEYIYKNFVFNAYQTTQDFDKKRVSDGEKEKRQIRTTGVSLKNEMNLKDNFIAMELEGYQDELRGKRGEGELESYPKGKSQNLSFSSHYEYSGLPKTKLLLGARVDHYDLESNKDTLENKNASHFSKSIGAIYSLTSKLDISANYSEGFNAPKIQEVYADGLHHLGDGFFIGDNYFIPNEELKPERSRMVEVGTKYQTQVLSDEDLFTFKAQYFVNRVDDYIYLEKIDRAIADDEIGTTQFINIPNVNLEGFETSLEYIFNEYSALISYSRIRGRDTDRNLWIADLPADQYLLKLQYDSYNDYSLGYLGNFVEAQNRVNPETLERTDKTPAYIVHSIFLKKKVSKGALKNFDILTRIENLTDTEYRKHGSNIYETGINLKFELGYRITL